MLREPREARSAKRTIRPGRGNAPAEPAAPEPFALRRAHKVLVPRAEAQAAGAACTLEPGGG